MGSVKDLQVLRPPTEKEPGLGLFHFSDRYSIFDWGEMPDHIPQKGAALCLMSAYCFEQAELLGMQTHYRGIRSTDGDLVRTGDLSKPASVMEVQLVRVIRPSFADGKYHYDVFTPSLQNFLIPLEIIYRNGLPQGSSFFKRLERGEIRFEDYGLDHYPSEGERLSSPIFDYSTKLEAGDRYISRTEARLMSGVSGAEMQAMDSVLSSLNGLITRLAGRAGLLNEDGKIEIGFSPDRTPMVVDVIGTLDECRFSFNGFHVSKEVTRQYYKHTPWYRDVEAAKQQAAAAHSNDWKALCVSQPPHLDPEFVEIVSHLYTASANAFLKRYLFDAPSLPDAVDRYHKWLKRQV